MEVAYQAGKVFLLRLGTCGPVELTIEPGRATFSALADVHKRRFELPQGSGRLSRTTPLLLMTEFAELINGRAAMLGFVIAVGTYATTGQIIPGVF
jgi:hypothetical protein